MPRRMPLTRRSVLASRSLSGPKGAGRTKTSAVRGGAEPMLVATSVTLFPRAAKAPVIARTCTAAPRSSSRQIPGSAHKYRMFTPRPL